MSSKFPTKVNNGLLEDEIKYCQKLITVIEENEVISSYPSVKEKINLLNELGEHDEQFNISSDLDAIVGYKTAGTSFLSRINNLCCYRRCSLFKERKYRIY